MESSETSERTPGFRDIFRSRRMAVQAGLGFSSGLPLLLTGQLLTLWLADVDLDIKTLAAFLSVGLAYTFKFTWAPVFDAFPLPFLGRRRGWILVFQLGLVGAIAVMANMDPAAQLQSLAYAAIAVAALSASQDVVVDALRADLLPPEQRAAGAALYMLGYRTAMLVVGVVGLGLAEWLPWRYIYLGAAALMALCTAFTFLAEEPEQPSVLPRLDQAIVRPFVDLFQRFDWRGALLILVFAASYKFGDQLLDGLSSVFYTKGTPDAPGLGFSKVTLASYTKVAGFSGLLLGGLVGGWLAPRLGLRKALALFGLTQALTNLVYVILAMVGKNYVMLGVAILCDSTANTMGTASLMAFFATVTRKELSATQYALLTSLSSVGKRVFGWWGGVIIADAGWKGFFAATTAMAVPGILLVFVLPKRLFARRDAHA